ncbi:MAG: hypothetical protein CMO21_11195 [Thioclava sp.]|nr:hypothetical protein [Thioclava sp.]
MGVFKIKSALGAWIDELQVQFFNLNVSNFLHVLGEFQLAVFAQRLYLAVDLHFRRSLNHLKGRFVSIFFQYDLSFRVCF